MRTVTRIKIIWLFLLLMFNLQNSYAFAGTDFWTSAGLAGISITAIAVCAKDPQIIYVGSANRMIFKSTDSGRNWEVMNKGRSLQPHLPMMISRQAITSLVVSPTDPKTIYVGVGEEDAVGFFFKSEDGGENFRDVPLESGNMDFLSVFSLVVNPKFPQLLLAGLGNEAHGVGGISRSTDGGESWALTLENGCITSLAIDPFSPETIYATSSYGRDGSFVYKSVDGGATWRRIDIGPISKFFPGIEVPISIRCVAIDPKTPSTLYVGTLGWGIYKSRDEAENWEPLCKLDPTSLNPADLILYEAVRFIGINPRNPNILYVIGGSGELLRSTDGGKSWEVFERGLPDHLIRVNCLAFDLEDPSKIYIGTSNGLYSIFQTDISVPVAIASKGKIATSWGRMKRM